MIEPDIVFMHKDWVILNKPEGYDVESLQNLWRNRFAAFHPAHRLDKDTSGLWLIALNSDANALLSAQFSRREMRKCYLALCEKKPKKKQGKIIGDMVRSRRSQWRLTQSRDNPAITSFKSVAFGGDLRLIVCKPMTGKTHQIRVAMKALGSPIAGDVIYDKANAKQFDRMYLHAYGLDFTWKGEAYTFRVLPRTGTHFSKAHLSISLRDVEDVPLQ